MERRGRLAATAVLAAVVPAATLGVLAARGDGPGDGEQPAPRPFRAEADRSRESFPTDLEGPNRYPVARPRGHPLLYDRPGGVPKLRITGPTEWGTPRVLAVVGHRRDWLAVLMPELENGQVAWIRMKEISRLEAVTWSLHADLSERTLVVRHDGRRVRRIRIGVGRRGHSTPVGRFAVTDRLRVTDPASPYGCCVLALTGHQTRLPPGWPGGDRLAVHATADLGGLGREVSLGCMRSHPRDAGWLIRKIPLGTPVFVQA